MVGAKHRSRSTTVRLPVAMVVALTLAACGSDDTATSSAGSAPDPSLTTEPPSTAETLPLTASRPAACRPESVPSGPTGSVDPGSTTDAPNTLLGGPLGIPAPPLSADFRLLGGFGDRRTADVIRFGCHVTATVVARRAVVSVYCDSDGGDGSLPDAAPCSGEVHDLPELELRSAFDVPASRQLEGAAGDLLVFSESVHPPGEQPVLLATTNDGRTVWETPIDAERTSIFVSNEVIVAARPPMPTDPVVVTVLDARTGAVLAEGDLEGELAGLGAGGLWEVRPVSVGDYGSRRDGDDGRVRVLDVRTLAVIAESGPELAGVRQANVDVSEAIVQLHTSEQQIELARVDASSLEPSPIAELPLADRHRSGAGPYSVIGLSDEYVLLRDYSSTQTVPRPAGRAVGGGPSRRPTESGDARGE